MSTDQQQTPQDEAHPVPQYAVRITITGPGQAPEGVAPVRHVGPYGQDWGASEAAYAFQRIITETWRDHEVHIEVVPFDATVAHLDPHPPTDIDGLAARISADPVATPKGADPNVAAWAFPGLKDRLVAAYGRNRAEWSWQRALDLIECRINNRGPAGDARLEQYRTAVKTASDRLVVPFEPPILDDAAQLLAALVYAADHYGVDHEFATGQLASFALNGVASRTPVPAHTPIAA